MESKVKNSFVTFSFSLQKIFYKIKIILRTYYSNAFSCRTTRFDMYNKKVISRKKDVQNVYALLLYILIHLSSSSNFFFQFQLPKKKKKRYGLLQLRESPYIFIIDTHLYIYIHSFYCCLISRLISRRNSGSFERNLVYVE